MSLYFILVTAIITPVLADQQRLWIAAHKNIRTQEKTLRDESKHDCK